MMLLAGCEGPRALPQGLQEPAAKLDRFLHQNFGISIFEAKPKSKPKETAGNPEATPDPDHRQVNAEFIKEAFHTVLQRDLHNEEEFLKYMNILDQGGHYEGIYNGLVYGSEYHLKEKGVAPVSALKTYADVLSHVLLDQKYDPLRIQPDDAKEVPTPENETSKPPQPTDEERKALVEEIEREAITTSTYALKRRLGEEVLKVIDLKREYREKLATWYGRFAVFLNKKGVDFGLPERNRPDEYYHYKWALEADEDRLKWECLNRVHALLNSKAEQ